MLSFSTDRGTFSNNDRIWRIAEAVLASKLASTIIRGFRVVYMVEG